MGLLLKALKQAETDRQAARVARQPGQADSARSHADAPIASGEESGSDNAPIQTRIGNHAPRTSTLAMPAYGGLWITLVLAVVSAAGFVYWMRGMSSVSPTSASAASVHASAPAPHSVIAPSTIPAALRVHEAGPLQLRLDRHVDTLGVRAR